MTETMDAPLLIDLCHDLNRELCELVEGLHVQASQADGWLWSGIHAGIDVQGSVVAAYDGLVASVRAKAARDPAALVLRWRSGAETKAPLLEDAVPRDLAEVFLDGDLRRAIDGLEAQHFLSLTVRHGEVDLSLRFRTHEPPAEQGHALRAGFALVVMMVNRLPDVLALADGGLGDGVPYRGSATVAGRWAREEQRSRERRSFARRERHGDLLYRILVWGLRGFIVLGLGWLIWQRF